MALGLKDFDGSSQLLLELGVGVGGNEFGNGHIE